MLTARTEQRQPAPRASRKPEVQDDLSDPLDAVASSAQGAGALDLPVQRLVGQRVPDQGGQGVRIPEGGGSPLSPALRGFFEPRMGQDLSSVRVHVGHTADALGARAFTRGDHLHFGPGEFSPGSDAGLHMIGHELTHRDQQMRGQVSTTGQINGAPLNDDTGLEGAADARADAMLGGEGEAGVGLGGSAGDGGGVLQRVGKEAFGYEKVDEKAPEGEEEESATQARNKRGELVVAVEKILGEVKQKQSGAKKKIEDDKNDFMEKNAGESNEKTRQDYLWNTYVPALRNNGMDYDLFIKSSEWQELQKKENLKVVETSKGADLQDASGVTFYKLYRGENAFRETIKADKGNNGLERDVYEKIGSKKEYVQDDLGAFTRRSAFVEKNKYQYWELMQDKHLLGRYGKENGLDKVYEKNANTKNRIKYNTGGDEEMTDWEMAYTHQELGSGPQQCGVSLSSTNKLIHSNQGESFKSKEGATIEIDLARVPKGKNGKVNLLNHYSQEAQKGQKGELDTMGMYTNKKGYGTVYGGGTNHYKDSVTKNRELLALDVPLSAISKIDKRFGPKSEKSETLTRGSKEEIDFSGTDSEKEQTSFQQGLQRAKGSRSNQSNVNVDTATVEKIGDSEGYNEGVSYNTEYAKGVSDAKYDGSTRTVDASGPTQGEQGYADGYNQGVDFNLQYDQGLVDAKNDVNNTVRVAAKNSSEGAKGYAAGYNEGVSYNVAYGRGYDKAISIITYKNIGARSGSQWDKGYAAGYNAAVRYNCDQYDQGYDNGKRNALADRKKRAWQKKDNPRGNTPYYYGWQNGYNDN